MKMKGVRYICAAFAIASLLLVSHSAMASEVSGDAKAMTDKAAETAEMTDKASEAGSMVDKVTEAVGMTEKVNVNSASAEMLEKIPGIGPTISSGITTYREANGAFKSLSDLTKIDGIDASLLEKIMPLLSI